MLRSIKEITGYRLDALDGKIGECKDFLFDEIFWTIRYMVADTARWLPGRKVLINPDSLGEPDWASSTFPVHLTKLQIERAPDLDERAPVSRQYEMKYYTHYGWPYYWAGVYAHVEGGYPPPAYEHEEEAEAADTELDDTHVRSTEEVRGYHIQATDGEIGHVEDFVVDDENWVIRYMVVDTRNWLPGRKVLVAPAWIARMDWVDRKVKVVLSRGAIKNGPEFDPTAPVNREYEERLYNYYGQPVYW